MTYELITYLRFGEQKEFDSDRRFFENTIKQYKTDDWETEELGIERLGDRKKFGKVVFKCPNCNGIIDVKYPFCPWCGIKKRLGGD